MSYVLLPRLISELPALGGWPEWAHECVLHNGAQKVMFYDEYGRFSHQPKFPQIEFDKESDVEISVSREAYEAALAASKPEWNGEGLPPVGVNAEVFFAVDTEPKWHSFLAKFIGEDHVIALVGLEEISYKKDELLTSDVKFAPLRSEWDRKRENLAKALHIAAGAAPIEVVGIGPLYLELADKIIAGEVAGIRID